MGSASETDSTSEAERTVEAERPQADDRASEVRSWFQPVRPASAEASTAEASTAPEGEIAPAQKVRGSDSGSKSDAETEPDTVIFPKLRVGPPPAQNGTATPSTPDTPAPAEASTAGQQQRAEAKTVPSAPVPPSPPSPPALSAPAETPAGAAPAEAERTPPPGGGGSDGRVSDRRASNIRAADSRAAAQKARGPYPGTKPPIWPDVLNETEPETVILPKLRVSRPQAQNGPVAARGATMTAARTGMAEHQPAEAKTAPPAASKPPAPAQTPAAFAPAKPERTPPTAPAAGDEAPGTRGKRQFRRRPRPAVAADAADGRPAAAPKARGGYFGLAPNVRPDVLTEAETIMLPMLDGSRGKTQAGSATDRRPAGGTATASGAVVTDAATQIMPVLQTPPAELAPAPKARRRTRPSFQPPDRYVTSRRTKRLSRLVLFVILCVQACLSLRLHNTAFEDEAQYLYAGHMELEHILHGSALQGDYTSFFSGSPVLYPVAAAALDQVGGLALARALSLVEMLAVTTMAYSIARYLFSERVGLYTAGLYAVTESVIFLGNFATYDATCLFLLAFAAWIMVYTARCRWPLFLLAAPVAALAVAVKYAGLLFVPTIAVLPALAAWPDRRRSVLLHSIGFPIAVAGLLYYALRLGGHPYMAAIKSTTTNRAQGTTPDLTIIREFAEWGGVVFAMAVFGAIAYARRVRTEPNEDMAPEGGRLRRAVLGVTLTGSALLAPAYQAHLHTDVSFLKHIGFGLFFAAPLAGFGLARLIGEYVRWPHLGVGVWCLALVLGMLQSESLYHVWPDSAPLVQALSPYLKPHAKYLVEVPEVPVYYLMGNADAQPDQFTSTYFITYYNTKGQQLTGPAGYAAAVIGGYFQVIAYSGNITLAADGTIEKELKASHSYYLAATVPLANGSGPVSYYIWVKGLRPPAPASYLGASKASRFLLPG